MSILDRSIRDIVVENDKLKNSVGYPTWSEAHYPPPAGVPDPGPVNLPLPDVSPQVPIPAPTTNPNNKESK